MWLVVAVFVKEVAFFLGGAPYESANAQVFVRMNRSRGIVGVYCGANEVVAIEYSS